MENLGKVLQDYCPWLRPPVAYREPWGRSPQPGEDYSSLGRVLEDAATAEEATNGLEEENCHNGRQIEATQGWNKRPEKIEVGVGNGAEETHHLHCPVGGLEPTEEDANNQEEEIDLDEVSEADS